VLGLAGIWGELICGGLKNYCRQRGRHVQVMVLAVTAAQLPRHHDAALLMRRYCLSRTYFINGWLGLKQLERIMILEIPNLRQTAVNDCLDKVTPFLFVLAHPISCVRFIPATLSAANFLRRA
jgi:hypothetical protein